MPRHTYKGKPSHGFFVCQQVACKLTFALKHIPAPCSNAKISYSLPMVPQLLNDPNTASRKIKASIKEVIDAYNNRPNPTTIPDTTTPTPYSCPKLNTTLVALDDELLLPLLLLPLLEPVLLADDPNPLYTPFVPEAEFPVAEAVPEADDVVALILVGF